MRKLAVVSEDSTVRIGVKGYTVTVPILGGDCITTVYVMNAIEFHDSPLSPKVTYSLSVFGDFNLYAVDTQKRNREIRSKISGNYDVYTGRQILIFVII